MLEQVLRHLNNWFPVEIREGTFTVEGGALALPFVLPGQYYRICGSVFNDGLHVYGSRDLTDETFNGTVWALAVPKDVTQLASEITEWQNKYGGASAGPYSSESFAGYTYTRATDAKTGGTVTWQSAFRSRLNAYRKIGNTDAMGGY